MASTQLLVVKDKVQRYAKQFFNVINVDDDGDLRITFESTHVVLQVVELDTSNPDIVEFREENDISKTVVNIFALVLFLGSLNIVFSAVIGTYLLQSLKASRARPRYFVSQEIN